MNSFTPSFEAKQPLTGPILQAIAAIYGARGKQDLWREQSRQILETLKESAIIQSTESSNRIERIEALPSRLRPLIRKEIEPRDRSEQEIAGYRDVLKTIHENHEGITFSANIVRQFHRDLFRHTPAKGGDWKQGANPITETGADGKQVERLKTLAPHLVPDAMDSLHKGLEAAWKNAEQYNPLLIIAAYILDFLCIHPFTDGNGRMARLIALLLLYRAGFTVGGYISLEKVIEENKERYYETLRLSSEGWHEGAHDLAPWAEYFLFVLNRAYRQFADRAGTVRQARGGKSRMVEDVIRRMGPVFSISEIEKECPGISRDTVRGTLHKLRNNGEVRCEGRGPGAVWRKQGGGG